MTVSQFTPATMQVAGKTLYDDPTNPNLGEYEFSVRDEVREAISDGHGVGLWMGPVPGLNVNVSSILHSGVVPRLVLLFEDTN